MIYKYRALDSDFVYAIFLIVLYGSGLIGLIIVATNLITVLRKHYPEFYQ